MTQSTKASVYLKTGQQELHKLRSKQGKKKKQCKASNSSGIILKGTYHSTKKKRGEKIFEEDCEFSKICDRIQTTDPRLRNTKQYKTHTPKQQQTKNIYVYYIQTTEKHREVL